MFPPNQPQAGFSQSSPQQNNNYYSSITGLAITCAIACTLLLAPWLANSTEGFARQLIFDFYGKDFIDIGLFIWQLLCFSFVFFITRAFVVAMIVSLGIGLAQRFPMLMA
ncbi:MAG: hypothetical protein GQ532_14285 [Methylomarinum sp.]|nr:hypothetical protein [Methylomarinum sp.]